MYNILIPPVKAIVPKALSPPRLFIPTMKIDPTIFRRRFEYNLSVQPLSDHVLEQHLDWCLERASFLHAVAFNPSQISLGAHRLAGSGILPAAGDNFPLAGLAPVMAQHEAREALRQGARQLDVVLPVGRLRSRELEAVQNETQELAALVQPPARLVLVAALAHLDEPLNRWCARLAASLGAALRTGSGYEPPASPDDVRIILDEAPALEVVACSGVSTLAGARGLLQSGVTRIATDDLPALLKGLEAQP